MTDEWTEKRLEQHHKNFSEYVDYVEIDYVYYSEEVFEAEEEVKLFDELEKSSLFVTDGDEAPWLQVMIKPGYSFALKPELLTYWCEEAERFYKKKKNLCSNQKKIDMENNQKV